MKRRPNGAVLVATKIDDGSAVVVAAYLYMYSHFGLFRSHVSLFVCVVA